MRKDLYTKDSIESLSPLEFTRLRPQVYAGDCTYSTQLLVEIISNAVDEFRLGHGNQIYVGIEKDVITVRDYGQGFLPNEKREDGKTILEAAFSVLNTSGKYREDGTYEGTSLGSFGIGSKITTFLSHWLDVQTWRDGNGEFIHFVEGEFNKRESQYGTLNENGTIVSWQPSEEFFENTEVEINKVKNLFKTITCLCPGLTIELNDNGEYTTYYSTNGLNDLVDEAVKDKELIKNRFNMNFSEGKNKMDIVLTYTSNYNFTMVPYVNTGLTEKGLHITQIKAILTREMNKFFRDKKWLKEKDENLIGDDIQEGMYIVFNLTAPNVGYDAQVKSTITKIDMSPFTAALINNLRQWFEINEKEVKIIADKAILARTAREKAKKARETVRKVDTKRRATLPGTLADASSKNRKECEVFIVEGKSAAGSTKEARDRGTQAVFPIRGKLLNVLKADLHKAMQNAEINGMITAFGLEVQDGKVIVNEDKLRYGKIVITADADVDGSHIRALFLTFIWKFAPDLINKGYIYAAVPPLYKVTQGTKITYLKDDAALEEFRKTNKKNFELGRMKGLGEMDPHEMAETVMNPDTRTLKQIVMEDAAECAKVFMELMGESVTPRKKFIEENAWRANVDV